MQLDHYNRYLTIPEAVKVLGASKSFFYVLKKTSKCPERFFVTMDGVEYVDMVEFNRQRDITKRCWLVNTDYLYWLMEELFENTTQMCRYLADKSVKFKSVNSWTQFLLRDLFCLPDGRNGGIELKLTQQIEFTLISTRLIYNKIKEGYYKDV